MERANPVWHKAFLTTLSNCGNVREACRDAGIHYTTAHLQRRSNPDFAKEWQEALDEAADILEKEAWRRAAEGTEEPVFHKGDICGHVRKYSDNLLMFMLKGMRPEKFREKVYVSTSEIDRLIEKELATLKGEDEENQVSKAVH